jgi:acyl-CoA thioester hydrolase
MSATEAQIKAWAAEIGFDDCRITRAGEPLLDATLTAAFLDPAGRPRRQPREWIALYHSLISQDA